MSNDASAATPGGDSLVLERVPNTHQVTGLDSDDNVVLGKLRIGVDIQVEAMLAAGHPAYVSRYLLHHVGRYVQPRKQADVRGIPEELWRCVCCTERVDTLMVRIFFPNNVEGKLQHVHDRLGSSERNFSKE